MRSGTIQCCTMCLMHAIFKKNKYNLVISKTLLSFTDEIKKKYSNISFSMQEKQNGTADAVKVAISKNKNFSDHTIIIWRYPINFKINTTKGTQAFSN